jgi:hypothetical protein
MSNQCNHGTHWKRLVGARGARLEVQLCAGSSPAIAPRVESAMIMRLRFLPVMVAMNVAPDLLRPYVLGSLVQVQS